MGSIFFVPTSLDIVLPFVFEAPVRPDPGTYPPAEHNHYQNINGCYGNGFPIKLRAIRPQSFIAGDFNNGFGFTVRFRMIRRASDWDNTVLFQNHSKATRSSII